MTKASDPSHEIEANEAFLVPTTALAPNTLYTVQIAGSVDGAPFTLSFELSTGH